MKRFKAWFFAAFLKVRGALAAATICIMEWHSAWKKHPALNATCSLLIFLATVTTTAIINGYFKILMERLTHVT